MSRDERAAQLELRLRAANPQLPPVQVELTENHRVVASVRADGSGPRRLRCHALFVDAPPQVVHELARFVDEGHLESTRKRSLTDWFGTARPPVDPRHLRHRAHGAHHDLLALADEQVAAHIPERPRAVYQWAARRRPGRRIRLGSYTPVQTALGPSGIVRVHGLLDDERVPAWLVGFVLFHELLHAVVPDERGRHHSPSFRARERGHPDHARAARWQREALPSLMRRWRDEHDAARRPAAAQGVLGLGIDGVG
jgi:hypothetical protein